MGVGRRPRRSRRCGSPRRCRRTSSRTTPTTPAPGRASARCPTRLAPGAAVRLIMDQGYDELYDSGTENKDDGNDWTRKARTDLFKLTGPVGTLATPSAASMAFPAQAAQTTGAPRAVTVTNSGSGKLRIGKSRHGRRRGRRRLPRQPQRVQRRGAAARRLVQGRGALLARAGERRVDRDAGREDEHGERRARRCRCRAPAPRCRPARAVRTATTAPEAIPALRADGSDGDDGARGDSAPRQRRLRWRRRRQRRFRRPGRDGSRWRRVAPEAIPAPRAETAPPGRGPARPRSAEGRHTGRAEQGRHVLAEHRAPEGRRESAAAARRPCRLRVTNDTAAAFVGSTLTVSAPKALKAPAARSSWRDWPPASRARSGLRLDSRPHRPRRHVRRHGPYARRRARR